jgi:hypothetical protein
MSLTSRVKKFGLVKCVTDAGGSIHPLILPKELATGPGVMNPSIFLDNGKLLVNIRNTNYTLYHAEQKKFQHQWGPLQYIHPENDVTLTTWNYLCELDDDLNLTKIQKIDTSLLDVKPLWGFIGLEDARLFRWDGKLYLCGVRRDTTDNGQGRMELSEIELTESGPKEVSRARMPIPTDAESYCEKNWVPVLNKPFHFLKWTNPTEIVKFDTETKKTSTVYLNESKFLNGYPDLRGSSHVLSLGDYYLTITHEVDLTKSELGAKDGNYRHRFVMWDKDWNVVRISDFFPFMNGNIEFCCGAAFYKEDILLSFSFQDNCAFILRVPMTFLREFLGI